MQGERVERVGRGGGVERIEMSNRMRKNLTIGTKSIGSAMSDRADAHNAEK
jgi:hypothetical protein